MAMNKKEKAEYETIVRELKVISALRWTAPVQPDVPIPESSIEGLSTGFLPCYDRVEVACSSRIFHAVGRTDKTTSQRPRRLYSTKLLALRALRYETERRCAEELAKVDAQINAEAK